MTESLVYMTRKHANVIEKRSLYLQNTFCYIFYDFGLPNRGEFSGFFSLVVRGDLENCSEPRRNFYTLLCKNMRRVLHLTA